MTEEIAKTLITAVLNVFIRALLFMFVWDYVMPGLCSFHEITLFQSFLLTAVVPGIVVPAKS